MRDAPGAYPERASGARPLVELTASTAQSSMAVSASFLLSSMFGASLALLLAVIVGEGARTDAFLAAYSVYLVFALFGSNLRVVLVPLLGPPESDASFRKASSERVGELLATTAVLTAVVALSSPLLGPLLVPEASPAAKSTATLSLAILALASYGQISAAALAAVLNAARRFAASAALYVLGSASTLALAAGLMALVGVTGAAVGVLGGALALFFSHAAYLRRFGFLPLPAWSRLRRRSAWALLTRMAAGSGIPFALQVNLALALAAVSGRVGAVTAYVYGYSLVLLMSAITSATIGLVTMPALVAALARRGRDAAGEYLLTTSPVSVFLYVPLASAYAVFGHAPLEVVLEDSLTPGTIDLLWDVSRIFLVMGLVWAVLAPLTTVALSLEMHGRLAVVAVALLVLQAIAVALASGEGAVAVSIAHAAVGVILVIAVLGVTFGRASLRTAFEAIARCLPAGALGLVFPALGLLGTTSSAALSVACAVMGLALYAGLGAVAWPSVGGVVVRSIRR